MEIFFINMFIFYKELCLLFEASFFFCEFYTSAQNPYNKEAHFGVAYSGLLKTHLRFFKSLLFKFHIFVGFPVSPLLLNFILSL